MINERIQKIRSIMNREKIDLYVIPTSDFHSSEYEGNYFKAREYMSGFTGSAGTLIITIEEAALFTDGRYFIQAKKEIAGTEITLYKEGEKDVPTVVEYICSKINNRDHIGFDGRVISANMGRELEKKLRPKRVKIKYKMDMAGWVWTDRPELESKEVFILDEKYTGETVSSKLERLRNEMKEKNADLHLLNTLDDIAWLYNIRGKDIEFNPVVYSYSIITPNKAYLFLINNNLQEEVKNHLKDNGVEILNYENVLTFFTKKARKSKGVLIDCNKINYSLYKCIRNSVNLVDATNPTTYFKAVKNDVEIENIKQAHIADGVCMAKFMFWLKNNVGKQEITQVSAADYLYNLRKSMDGFIEESFRTISAYNENAAMMHYSPYNNPKVKLKNQGILLVDSGAHYYKGSTDITRTIILGDVSDDVKFHYTTVVKSMLRLSKAKFLYGCTGLNLDVIARGPIWDHNIDYKSGTGHGVGYLLNIHEGPNSFRWKNIPGRENCVLEAGMITTDEPGIYVEGSHGIRIENELLCIEDNENEYGKFMSFEPITYAPIDMDGILEEQLEESDLKEVYNYNKMVLEKLSPYLSDEEIEFFTLGELKPRKKKENLSIQKIPVEKEEVQEKPQTKPQAIPKEEPVQTKRSIKLKKLLFIFNPYSGKALIKQNLVDILDIFIKEGYKVSVRSTQSKYDAMKYVKENASYYDLIVCSGGDGTLNEVMTGLMYHENKPELGYIPAGSTNDFSVGLKLPKNMIKAATVAVKGKPFPVDMGTFNKKMFIYVAAFGAFSEVSYKTSQGSKNMLGHTAYVLEALKSVRTIKAHHLIMKFDDNIIEGNFIYGMITNAVSVGGIKGIVGDKVSLNDGLFEVMLIKKPKNPADVQSIASALMGIKTESECVVECKASKIYIKNIDQIPWTLDGEFGGNPEKIVIKNHKRVINIMSGIGLKFIK